VIKELAAKSNLKAVTLELGGKSPCIIFADADLSEAIPAAAFSIANNSGQICMASSRVYVHESIANKFVTRFSLEFQKSMGTPGDPLDASTTHAPQVDQAQFRSVMGFIDGAKAQGMEPIIGGKRIGHIGFFIEPTIFLNPDVHSSINRDEVFGPVVVVNTFKTEEEVLKVANDTEYGLYASVFTKDISRALRLVKGLESGMVGVNCTSPTAPFDMPFGGIKQSGDGREFSHMSLIAWTETKTVMFKI
jgi:aldehyde dehydrogenase (NAD+)